MLSGIALVSPAEATFPGDNGRIAYELGDGEGLRIHSAEPDGDDPAPLTGYASVEPSYSADGEWVVYNRNWNVWRMRSDGSDKQAVLRRPDGLLFHNPKFAPDGRKVVFDSTPYCTGFVVRVNGEGRRRLGRDVCNPSWSPDGRLIAYTHETKAETRDLFVMRPDGTGIRNISRKAGGGLHGSYHEYSPDWAPDSRRLLFSADKIIHEDVDIWSVRLNGSDLTHEADHSEYEGHPVFSPDGESFAFSAQGVGVFRAALGSTSAPEAVVPGGQRPAWQPR